MICHEHSNPRFHDRLWAKMIQLSSIIHIKMWPFTQLPIKRNLALRKNIVTPVLSILQCMKKIKIDMDSLMPKKRKDLFVSRNIVISKKKLKCNQMICD